MKESLEKKVAENKTIGKFVRKLGKDSKFRKKFTYAVIGIELLISGGALYSALESASDGEYFKAAIAGVSSMLFAYLAGYASKK